MDSERDEDIFELVGTHTWNSLIGLRDERIANQLRLLRIPAEKEFDFIDKERIAAGVKALEDFFTDVETRATRVARRN